MKSMLRPRDATLRFFRFFRIALLAQAVCTPFKDDVPGAPGRNEVEAGKPCDPKTPFGPAMPVQGLTDIATSVAGLRLSRDSLTAYFNASGGPDSNGYYDLYTATRDSPTSAFAHIALLVGSEINIGANELDPTVSGDGLRLVFARGEPDPGRPIHLFTATRSSIIPFTGVGPLVGANERLATYDYYPFLLDDGQVLYFASSRFQPDGLDIYGTVWNAGTASFDTPSPVGGINTTFSEIAPVVTPDDLTIYFGSDRTDMNAPGSFNIWMATRTTTNDVFAIPTIVPELNSPGLDLPTFVTRDGCTLYLSSTRDPSAPIDGGVKSLAMYVATKQPPAP
jgi:Tol biopolymer transport system component